MIENKWLGSSIIHDQMNFIRSLFSMNDVECRHTLRECVVIFDFED